MSIREELLKKWIRGERGTRGIEIGAGHSPLWVPPECEVSYIDAVPMAELRRRYKDAKDLGHVIDDGETLSTIGPKELDFVLSSHVLEHCQDPIGALMHWVRVLKPGGIIWCAVPEKTQTFDRNRPVTSFLHLELDHEVGPARSQAAHYAEWFSMIDGFRGEELEAKVKQAVADNCNIHFHVWDAEALKELFFKCQIRCGYHVVDQADNGAEWIWVLKKT